MFKNKVITIDGLIATGKSTVSKSIALELNGIYLPTGKLYRLFSFYAYKENLIDKLDEIPKRIKSTSISFSVSEDLFKIENFSYKEDDLYSFETLENLSHVAANQNIRELANLVFRQVIESNADTFLILEGRDAGTIIYPEASIKFWLDVDLEQAAKRRFIQIQKTNKSITYEQVLLSIKERDTKDSSRTVAPIIKAEDAITINTTNLTQQEVIKQILSKVENHEETK